MALRSQPSTPPLLYHKRYRRQDTITGPESGPSFGHLKARPSFLRGAKFRRRYSCRWSRCTPGRGARASPAPHLYAAPCRKQRLTFESPTEPAQFGLAKNPWAASEATALPFASPPVTRDLGRTIDPQRLLARQLLLRARLLSIAKVCQPGSRSPAPPGRRRPAAPGTDRHKLSSWRTSTGVASAAPAASRHQC